MKTAKFYKKPENMDDLRDKNAEEIFEMIACVVDQKSVEEIMRDPQQAAGLQGLVELGKAKARPYEIIHTIKFDAERFDELANNLGQNHGLVSAHKEFCEDKGDGIIRCIAFYCKERDDSLLIDPAGYDYARYAARVPRTEVEGLIK